MQEGAVRAPIAVVAMRRKLGRAAVWWLAIMLCALFWAGVALAWPRNPAPIAPPAAYRVTTGVAIVRLAPRAEVAQLCGEAKAMACFSAGVIIMPDPWAYDPVTWSQLFIHELSHARGGWPAAHPLVASGIAPHGEVAATAQTLTALDVRP